MNAVSDVDLEPSSPAAPSCGTRMPFPRHVVARSAVRARPGASRAYSVCRAEIGDARDLIEADALRALVSSRVDHHAVAECRASSRRPEKLAATAVTFARTPAGPATRLTSIPAARDAQVPPP